MRDRLKFKDVPSMPKERLQVTEELQVIKEFGPKDVPKMPKKESPEL